MNNRLSEEDKNKTIHSSTPSFLSKFKHKKGYILTGFILFFIIVSSIFIAIYLLGKNSSIEREYLLEDIPMSRYTAATEYIISCFENETGGFRRKPLRQFDDTSTPIENADLRQTWLSYNTLHSLDELDRVNVDLLQNWVIDELHRIPELNGPEDIFNAYTLLGSLNKSSTISNLEWANMILDDYEDNGGFTSGDYGEAFPSNTYFAYCLLDKIDMLNLINWTKATEYIQSFKLIDGYYSNPLLPDLANFGDTVYAYSFLKISNQTHLLNITLAEEIMKESFLWNYQNAYRITITYVLLEFTRIFDYLFTDFYPNYLETLLEIKNSQQNLHGNFPFSWVNASLGDIYDTCWTLQIFHDSNSLNLLNETIIISHPPLSPFTNLSKISFSFLTCIVIILSVSLVFTSYKRKS